MEKEEERVTSIRRLKSKAIQYDGRVFLTRWETQSSFFERNAVKQIRGDQVWAKLQFLCSEIVFDYDKKKKHKQTHNQIRWNINKKGKKLSGGLASDRGIHDMISW